MRPRPSAAIQLVSVVRKEILQTVRDKRVMFMLMVAPVLQLVVFGFAVDFTVDNVPTAVVDMDQTQASRQHLRRILADGTLRRRLDAPNPEVSGRALETGEAAASIIFPYGFQRDLDRGETAEVQVVLDGSDPNRSTGAALAVSRYFAQTGAELARERALSRAAATDLQRPPMGSVDLTTRIWFNPGLATPPFLIPGVLAMLLVVVTTIVTSMGLAREREIGTMEQVLVTPMRPQILLLGKLLPFLAIGCFDVAFGLTVGAWVFSVPIRGSVALVFAATLCYVMTTLGIGLLISTFSRTQQQAFLGAFLFAMPALLLSGVMTPIRAMPEWLQLITLFNPLRYYVVVMRETLLKGAGLPEVWGNLMALAVFGLLILTSATLRFHKRLA